MPPLVETTSGTIWFARTGELKGGRPPLILIHGAGGNHLLWPPAMRKLTGVCSLAVDLPGHGRSAGPGLKTIDDYAAVILALMNAHGIERSVLCGHSMGGAVALQLTLAVPEQVAGLVLIGTGARLRVAPALLDGIFNDYQRTMGLLTKWLYGPMASTQLVQLGMQAMSAIEPVTLHGDFVACDQFDVRHRLSGIQSPALVICGEADKMTPLKYSQFLTDGLPHARLRVFEGAGHMVTLERPEEVAAAVSQFLTSII